MFECLNVACTRTCIVLYFDCMCEYKDTSRIKTNLVFGCSSKFIQFAWGRQRLPRPGNWSRRMLLSRTGKPEDLPVAHTCFFHVEVGWLVGWLVGWCFCVCSFLPFLFFLFFTVVVFMPPLICFFNNSVPPPLAASTLRNTGASQKNAGINHQIRSWHHDVYVNVKGI